jgi:hypothetical protein
LVKAKGLFALKVILFANTMRNQLFTILFMTVCISGVLAQAQEPTLKKLLKRDNNCAFEGATVTLDTANFAESRNVSYSYSYMHPKYFKEVWPQEQVISEVRKRTDAYIDTVTYVERNGEAQFKIFAGQAIPFPVEKKRMLRVANILAVDKAVSDYIKLLKAGKDKELGKVKILSFCKGVKGYKYTICLKGSRADNDYIYKIIVAEMPGSDELIFSHFLYQYKAALKDKYEAMGLTLANSFRADQG